MKKERIANYCKYSSCLIALIMLYSNIFAQKNLGNEWYIGLANSKIIFEKDSGIVKLLNPIDSQVSYTYDANSNICDTNGQLILATSAYSIYGGTGKEFFNGTKINTDSFNWYNGLSVYPNNSIFIPKCKDKYYLFISTQSDSMVTDFVNNGGIFDFDVILYSLIDMNVNNGEGAIVSNRNVLLKTSSAPWISKSNLQLLNMPMVEIGG
jgi:hypothetical protein